MSNVNQEAQVQMSDAFEDLGISPESSVAAQPEAASTKASRVVKRQRGPSLASGSKDLAPKGRKGRKGRKACKTCNRVAETHANVRVTKRGSKAAVRRKKTTSGPFYVVFQGNLPLKLCEDWLVARKKSSGFRGRWTKRFDTRAEAEYAMQIPDETSSEEEEEEEEEGEKGEDEEDDD